MKGWGMGVHAWMRAGQTVKQTGGWMDGWWRKGEREGWRWMHEYIDDRWMDGQVDGRSGWINGGWG